MDPNNPIAPNSNQPNPGQPSGPAISPSGELPQAPPVQPQTQPVQPAQPSQQTFEQPQPISQPVQPVPPQQSQIPGQPPMQPGATQGPVYGVSQPPVQQFQPQPKKGNGKLILIIAGSVIFVFFILPIVVVLILGIISGASREAGAPDKDTSSKSQVADQGTGDTQQVAVPAGYVALNKLCFTVQVPEDNDAGEEDSCRFSASFGADKLASIRVSQFTKYREGLDANVAELKRSEGLLKNTLVSEEAITIGGLPAKKLVYKGSGQYGITTAYFLVATDKYKIDGVPVTGFSVVAPTYDKPEVKSTIDAIIASWQWK